MTGKSLWQQIKDVVACDQKIAALSADITSITTMIAQEEASLLNFQKNLDSQKRALIEAQKNVHTSELNARELKDNEERKRKLLDNAREQKEYMALKRELEVIAQKRIELDDTLMKQWYEVEQLKEAITHTEANKDEHIARLAHDIQVKKENVVHLTHKREQTGSERAQALTHLPLEWIAKYNRMYESVPDPIVPVVNGNCSSCFYTILHHDLSKLKSAQVLVCRSCYRLLYYDMTQEQHQGEASY